MGKFICERYGEVRVFETIEDAEHFVLREGDRSHLWTLTGPGVAERREARVAAAIFSQLFEIAA